MTEFLTSNLGDISYMAIKAVNAGLGASIPVFRLSQKEINHIKNTAGYLKANVGVKVDHLRQTINNFKNNLSGRRTESLNKSLQQQQNKEEEWRQKLMQTKIGSKSYQKQAQENDLSYADINKDKDLTHDFDEEQTAQELNQLRLRDKVKGGLKNIALHKAQQTKIGQAASKVKKTQEDIKRIRNIYRIINGTSAVTLIGLIVTWSVMMGQFIFGNILKSKKIPKLEWWELLALGLVNLILILGVLFLILIIYIYLNPCEALTFIKLDFVKGLCNEVIPGVSP